MRSTRPYAAFVAATALSWPACGGSPLAPSKTCRRYPVSLSLNRTTPLKCSLSGAAGAVARGFAGSQDAGLVCSSPAGYQVWSFGYASLRDFVLEAEVPNRMRLRSREYRWLGTFASQGSGGNWNTYRYDGQGRLVERVRNGYFILTTVGTVDYDRTVYTSWDPLGRPTAGATSAGEDAPEPFTITYDDGARLMESTTGETTERDVDGNVIHEIEVIGGQQFERSYEIQKTAEVCL